MATTKDPYRYFRVEARELLDRLAKGLLDIEKGAAPDDAVAQLLRLAHTLKGAARVVRQRELSDLAHAVEDALGPYRESALPRAGIDAVLRLVDAMAAKLAQLPGPTGETAAATAPSTEDATRWVRAEAAAVDELLDGLGEAFGELATIRRSLAEVQRARLLAATLAQQAALPRIERAPRTGRVRARAAAEELHAAVAALQRDLVGSVDRVERELREMRELAERLRLVPAASVFDALERTARDAAQGTGKRVRFEASGGDIRLDSHVLQSVAHALAQLVRNAVVHGIEAEAERLRANKPVEGRVALEVLREGQRVLFRCRDDGRGVDVDAVRSAARRKGHLVDDPARPGAEGLLDLLLRGGISTSGTVTELSGRGIGLDIVREVAQRLDGEVAVHTEHGAGSSFELRVPVDLALVEALIVGLGGETAAVPLDEVLRTVRAAPQQRASAAGAEVILHDGELIPLVRPTWGGAAPQDGQRSNNGQHSNGRPVSAFVVAGEHTPVAVAVDRFHGIETITLRPFSKLMPAATIASGAYLDADGNPRVVLDPRRLAELSRQGALQPLPGLMVPRPILIIDDSLTTRMLEKSILESAGYEADLATSAEEALVKAHRSEYGLFLVDVEMPGMDGFGFVERTREDASLRGVPCILVTSRNGEEDRRRGQAVGARGYIVKGDFDQAEFLGDIARLVRR